MPGEMEFTSTLSDLAKTLRGVNVAVSEVVKRYAFKLEATMVNHLADQDLDWEELDAGYLQFKDKAGLSELKRIATNVSMESIRAMKIGDDSYFVGWARGVQTSNEGEDPIQINAVHEFGSNDGTIDARPLIGPSVEELAEEFEADMSKALEGVLS